MNTDIPEDYESTFSERLARLRQRVANEPRDHNPIKREYSEAAHKLFSHSNFQERKDLSPEGQRGITLKQFVAYLIKGAEDSYTNQTQEEFNHEMYSYEAFLE